MARNSQDTLETEMHWVEICRAAAMLGIIKDFSKGECLRLNKMLTQSKHVKKLGRGRYQLINFDYLKEVA
ncbi:MAG: hypothetical protein ACLQFW_10480 [Xanthobacteraceae bacterium]